MAHRVVVTGTLGSGDLDQLCSALEPLPALKGRTEIELDLSRLEGASPAVLSLLVASFRDVERDAGCDPTWRYVPPQAAPLARSLEAGRFSELLTMRGDITPPALADGAHGCIPFSTRDAATATTRRLEAMVSAQAGAAPGAFRAAAWMLGDFADNVLEHAETHSGVAAARLYPTTREIEFAVADRGIGIRASLVKNPDYVDVVDDMTAIARAVNPATTSEPGVGGGYGLFLASLVVKENGGTLIIRSGTAELTARGEDIEKVTGLPDLRGTVVVVRVSTSRPLDFDRVDRLLKKPAGAVSRRG